MIVASECQYERGPVNTGREMASVKVTKDKLSFHEHIMLQGWFIQHDA
jgi:hypothetical protein